MTLEHRQKHIVILICVGIIAGTFVAYEPIRRNGFVNYDDDKYITKNPEVTGGITLQSVIWAFTKPYAANWHPSTWLSHMLDSQLFGLNPVRHHFVSVVIHIVNALLLLWILTNITGAIWPSAFVAAVFALHPLQVESVAWAAERKTVLSGLFWLLTIAAYVRYTRRPGFLRYLLVLLVFGLCIMTKPIVVTLPLVLLLMDYWPLERLRWGHQTNNNPPAEQKSVVWLIAEKIPLLAMSAFLSVMTIFAQRSGGAISTLENFPLDYRIANTFLSYIKYICKTVWPGGLGVYYPYPRVNFSDMTVVVCTATFVLLTVFGIYAGRRRKYIAVGWLWFVGTLVPMTGLVQVGMQGMADRYMYISILGLLIIAAWFVKGVLVKQSWWKVFVAILAGAALSTLIILTRIQVGHWENDLTLFEHTLKVTKDNAAAEHNYGAALFKAGRLDEARVHLSEAIRLIPAFTEAINNLGKVLLIQGNAKEAAACFNELLRRGINTAETHYNLALALMVQTKYEEAVRHFAEALKLDPNFPDAHNKMGISLTALGRIDEATACFRELLRKNENSVEANYNLGMMSGSQGKYDDAARYFAQVASLDPNYPEIHKRLTAALLSAGREDEAIAEANETLRKSNNPAKVFTNIGEIYYQLGKYKPAIENWTKALAIKADSVDALNNLAWLLASVNNPSIRDANKAIEYAERACKLTGYKEPTLLDTLAVAYAAGDRFEDAVRTAQQAIETAKSRGQDKLAGNIQKRMELYKAGQRYIQK